MAKKDDATAADAGAPAAGKFDALLEQWIADHFRGGPIARNTECWNVLQAALGDLKDRLNAAA